MNTRSIIVSIATLITGLLLSGCGAAAVVAAADKADEPAKSERKSWFEGRDTSGGFGEAPDYDEPEPEPVDERVALRILRGNHPELRYIPAYEIRNTGRMVCEALDSGISAGELIVTLSQDPSLDHGMVGGVLAYGVLSFCPEYKREMRRTANALG